MLLDLLKLKNFLTPFLASAVTPGVATVASGLREYAPDVYARLLAALAALSDAEVSALTDLAARSLGVPVFRQAWFGFVVRELHRRACYAETQKAKPA